MNWNVHEKTSCISLKLDFPSYFKFQYRMICAIVCSLEVYISRKTNRLFNFSYKKHISHEKQLNFCILVNSKWWSEFWMNNSDYGRNKNHRKNEIRLTLKQSNEHWDSLSTPVWIKHLILLKFQYSLNYTAHTRKHLKWFIQLLFFLCVSQWFYSTQNLLATNPFKIESTTH